MDDNKSPNNNLGKLISLYKDSIKNLPILRYSWVLVTTMIILAIAGYFSLKTTDVFYYAVLTLIICFLGFVFSYMLKVKDKGVKAALYILIYSIIITMSLFVLGLASYIVSNKPSFYSIFFHSQKDVPGKKTPLDTADSQLNQSKTIHIDTLSQLVRKDPNEKLRGSLKIDSVFFLATKNANNRIAIEILLTNSKGDNVLLESIVLFNIYECLRAGITPFLQKIEYDILIDSLESEIVDSNSISDFFNAKLFERDDTLGYLARGKSTRINSNEKLSYTASIELPLLLTIPKNSKTKIRFVFSKPRKKQVDFKEQGKQAPSAATKIKTRMFNVTLRTASDANIVYSIDNLFLIETLYD